MTSRDEAAPPDPGAPERTRATGSGRRVGSALPALLVVVAIFGIAWALTVPPFQAPDEITHWAYAQSLATRFALPGDPRRPLLSSDELDALQAPNASALTFSVGAVRPVWSRRGDDAYLALARRHPSQSDGGGPNPQAVNPPLFYLYSDLAYWASGSASAFTRLYAMRLWGVVLLLGNVVAAWLLAGEVFGRRRRLAQLLCASVCGLMPMETFMSTSINPDALMVPLWTTALWLGARLIGRGWRTRHAVALGAVTAAAVLTKATSYALVPAVLLVVLVVWLRRPAATRRGAIAAGVIALAALAVPTLGWVLYAQAHGRPAVNTVAAPAGAGPLVGFRITGLLSYIWQFYLPRLPFMSPHGTSSGLAVYEVWIKQGWATFGWLDVLLPTWTYPVFGAITAGIGLLAAVRVAALRCARKLALLGYFALAFGALLFGLHLTAYRSLIADQGPLLQGRYLLPVIGLFGLAVAIIVVRVPPRWRGPAAGIVLAGLLLLQVLSLATVAKVYYT